MRRERRRRKEKRRGRNWQICRVSVFLLAFYYYSTIALILSHQRDIVPIKIYLFQSSYLLFLLFTPRGKVTIIYLLNVLINVLYQDLFIIFFQLAFLLNQVLQGLVTSLPSIYFFYLIPVFLVLFIIQLNRPQQRVSSSALTLFIQLQ